MKKLIILLLTSIWALNSFAQSEYSFVKQTLKFSEKNGESLYLDKYSAVNQAEKSPCIIFVFGGAFSRGQRDVPKYMPYFDYLVKNGYVVVSIDYRLGLKEASKEKNPDIEKFAKVFINTIDMAVEDLFDATNFILERANEWKIDPNYIITNGSSAGAVTVLQAEYTIINNTFIKNKLPRGFNYAGVISFAGAIFTPEGGLKWDSQPCPMLLMHGDADLQVPYNTLMYKEMGFYGAYHIQQTLNDLNYPFYFYSFYNYGHEIASDPMRDNKDDVLQFLNSFVKEKKQYQIVKEQKEIGKRDLKKNFEFEDYFRGNYDR